VTVLHEAKPGAPMESLTVAIRAGTRHGDRAGLAEAVARVMTRETGSFNRTELQNHLDRLGFTLQASTDRDAAYISLQFPSGWAGEALALLTEILLNPRFSEQEWGATREEMIAELTSMQDQPRSVAADLLYKTAFVDTTYGRSIEDRLRDLPDLDADSLRAFWSDHYHADAMAVAYYGGASREAVSDGLAELEKLAVGSMALAALEIPEIEEVIHRPVAMPGKTQANIYIAWHAPAVGSQDWIHWKLAAKALGGDLAGRLWKLRQDEGLAYSVGFGGDDMLQQPLTHVYMATAAEKREDALAAIHREIRRARDGLTEGELDRVKVSYIAQLNRLDRTAARRTNRHARWWVDGVGADFRERLTAAVAEATLSDVNRVISDVLDPDRYLFVEAGAVPAE
jgi:predicted Zn-dependent peptidase